MKRIVRSIPDINPRDQSCLTRLRYLVFWFSSSSRAFHLRPPFATSIRSIPHSEEEFCESSYQGLGKLPHKKAFACSSPGSRNSRVTFQNRSRASGVVFGAARPLTSAKVRLRPLPVPACLVFRSGAPAVDDYNSNGSEPVVELPRTTPMAEVAQHTVLVLAERSPLSDAIATTFGAFYICTALAFM